MTAILIIGIFVSFAQSFLLLNKRGPTVADRILAVWMLIIGIHLTNYSLYDNGYWEQYPHLVGLTVPFPLLYGPMLYLYVRYSLRDASRFNKADLIHFLPSVASYIVLAPFFFLYSADEKRMLDAGQIEYLPVFTTILLVGFITSGIGYAVVSYRHLKRHRALVDANFSNETDITLDWLRTIILGIGGFFLAATAVIIIQELGHLSIGFDLSYILYSFLVFGILWLGYHGVRHKNMFTDNAVYLPEDSATSGYRTSGLSEDAAKDLYARLISLMGEEKPYLEPKLTLTALADMLDTSPNYLSQVINQHEQQNFNQFINEYRIRDFEERARNNAQLTLLAHAFDVGFNSKSTFNMVFKRHRGMTPSQFMAQGK